MLLLLMVTAKRQKVYFGNIEIELKPGQIVTGRKKIAEMVNNGLSESAVERALKDFEKAQQIEQQTNSQGRLITLKNWGKYQASEQRFGRRMNNKRTANEQQTDTIKNVKNRENVKNERGNALTLGKFNNVILSQAEYETLVAEYPDYYNAKIERLSSYVKQTGKNYKSHYAVLMDWLEKDVGGESADQFKKTKSSASYDIEELENIR